MKYPSINLIADYLRACGAGFEDLHDLLKAYTAQPPALKQTCDAAGVPAITCPFCICFGRELWSLCRREFSGESLAPETATLIAKWVARRLTQSVPPAIRSDVFNVPAPVAPQRLGRQSGPGWLPYPACSFVRSESNGQWLDFHRIEATIERS